jgi:hypothetical protein
LLLNCDSWRVKSSRHWTHWWKRRAGGMVHSTTASSFRKCKAI